MTTQASPIDLLQSPTSDNPTWRDMVEGYSTVMYSNVEQPIEQLETIRFLDKNTDYEIVKRTVRMLGFDVSQDVLNLNVDVLTKLVTQLPHYADQNGTEQFINFEELLLNSQIELEYLYTQDYVNFYSNPQGGLLIDSTGNWFKSTHINIAMELKNFQNLLLLPGQSLYSRVKSLFYSYAPIALVIEHFTFIVTFKVDFGIGAALTNNMAYITLE